MKQELQPSNQRPSDEIELGDLFRLIQNMFKAVFRWILALFIFLKRSFWILLALVVVGVIVGVVLKHLSPERLITEVIVKPDVESKNYLYDVVAGIQSNIQGKDTIFFNELGIDINELEGFEIDIVPLGNEDADENLEDEILYLELLEKFQGTDFIADILRTEIFDRSTLTHRITFYYKDREKGSQAAERLMKYINANPYFKEVNEITRENAEERIKSHRELVNQIDQLLTSYTQNSRNEAGLASGRLVLTSEEQLDVTGLLNLKNFLVGDIGRKRLELQTNKNPINIIHFGVPQEVQRPLFGKKVILLPTILVAAYLLWSLGLYLNRKAREYE